MAGIHAALQASNVGTHISIITLLMSKKTATKISLPQARGTAMREITKAQRVPVMPIKVALDIISKTNFVPPNPIAPNMPISTDLAATLEKVK